MALNGPGIKKSFKAGEDLSTHQYKFVYLSAADTVSLVTATTDVAIGVLQNTPTLGQDADVMIMGLSKVVAGDDLSVGELVYSDDGTATKNTLGGATHDRQWPIYGKVTLAAAASDNYATIAVNCATPKLFENALA